MANAQITYDFDERHKKRSALLSLIVHILLFLILLIPMMTFPIPPPGQQGILVTFGDPESGGATSAPSESEETNDAKTSEEKQIASASAEKPRPTPDIETKVVEETPSEVTGGRKKSAEEIAEEERKKAEEARKKKEAEAARKKAEEERKQKEAYEQTKKEYSDLFGSGDGNQSGQQGELDGDPDAEALKGISTGSGRVGGGLGSRGLVFEPDIKEYSQKEGKVVVKVCVDPNGKVTSAKWTGLGSTTTDSDLRKVAIENAKKYVFSESEIEEQCGTITIDFILI